MAPPEAPAGHWVQGSSEDEIRFFPPLAVQRQAWALGVLRRESVRSVLDVGCGEGSLLRALVSPAPAISESPVLPENAAEADVAANSCLHIESLSGLDIDRGSLESFASFYLPPDRLQEPEDNASSSSATPNGAGYVARRWTDLTVSLWQGDLTAFNDEFCSCEAIVALEVIEHLEQHVLDKFAPMILGEYRPRLLLVTTPNYAFNSRFDRQSKDRRGFLDPTGRTNRVFRNDDHKMEWTPDEFQTWCDQVALEYGYTVATSLIGPPLGDVLPPTADARAASQAAVFTRSEPKPMRSPRSLMPASLPFFHPDGNALAKHQLVRRAILPALQSAGRPAAAQEIREETRGLMEHWGQAELALTELWPELGEVAGGSKRALVAALGGWGNVPPATPDSAPSRPSTPATAAPLDPAEFVVFLPPEAHTAGPPFDSNQLRVRWRDFAEAVGADQAADEDQDRGYGDEGDGWGPIPVAMRPGTANGSAEGGGGETAGW